MNKFFMLGLAGLAFAACSNDEDATTQFPEGNGALSIRIVNPVTTRAEVAGTTQNVTVTGPVLITLEATNGNQTISLTAEQLEEVTKVGATEEIKFWNVQGPKKVTVAMNGGQASYDAVPITDNQEITMSGTGEDAVKHQRNMQSVAGVAAYGETSSFVADGLDTPDLDDNVYETGATSADDGKQYEMYKATVQLAIPVARLEVDGITHVQAHITTPADCKYATLTIDGVYMDNIMPNGANVTTASSRVDYKFPGDNGRTAIGDDAILYDEITSASFLTNASWPTTDGEVFAYNFYAPTTAQAASFTTQEQKNAINPQFKVYFESATGKDGNNIAAPRYAMITKYRASNSTDPSDPGIVLEAGKVYRIIDAVLDDENIIGDEGGNTQFGVNVVVEEAVWTVVDIKADWAE